MAINWNITPTTRYTAADCAKAQTPGICVPGALVIPGMVPASLVLPLVPAGTVRFPPRENLLNLSVRRVFRYGKVEYSPEFALFNALNADTVVAERSANFGSAAYAVPSRILQARLPRISLRVRW